MLPQIMSPSDAYSQCNGILSLLVLLAVNYFQNAQDRKAKITKKWLYLLRPFSGNVQREGLEGEKYCNIQLETTPA